MSNSSGSTQEKAIHDYLEALLLEVADEVEDSPVNAVVAPVESEPLPHKEIEPPQPVVVGLENLVAEIPEVVTDVEIVTEVVVEQQLDTQTVEQEQQVEQVSEAESAVPEWAEKRFQCLLFKVSGLSLAVPLIKLNSVISWDEEITETPNQTEWYLGLIQHLKKQVKVIDTALLVMPENRRDVIRQKSEDRLGHILLVDDYQWGLACDSIGDVIWLSKDEVKWRKNKSSRAWLLGTSLDHLCAIMDTDVFAKMLNNPG